MEFFDLDFFIKNKITNRADSFFKEDIVNNKNQLNEEIKNSSILVIGGAGTIGSSYIKTILNYRPSKLIVVDKNENGLAELVRDLRSTLDLIVPSQFITYPIDFGSNIFDRMFLMKGPFDIIANFAAHKHVRSEKDAFSIEAMLNNNVFNVEKLCRLSIKMPPKKLFCVSTDKAANPANVMGASKKLMEEILLAYSDELPITSARFANVAFSNGSLLHGFMERFLRKQPLSSPLDIKRYFVSPEESGQLCMLANILGLHGEVFFPKLKPDQMKTFSEIAIEFLHEFGMKPIVCKSEKEAKILASNLKTNDDRYPVYFFESDTSGEKAFEEFYTDDEEINMEKFISVGIINSQNIFSITSTQNRLRQLQSLFEKEHLDKREISEKINQLIPSFSHFETNKNLDQKM